MTAYCCEMNLYWGKLVVNYQVGFLSNVEIGKGMYVVVFSDDKMLAKMING